MGSLVGSPKTWIPYMNTEDCSQGFCSLYCPQWCYILIPPPPAAFVEEFPHDKSYSSPSPNFSPLVIAIIGILVSAFLLISYYTVISKYCVNEDDRRRSAATGENHDHQNTHEFDHNPSIHEPWHVITAGGLDEALINSLPVCKYKIGDCLVEGTDCSVCLSEFEQDESLRLLPKCNHAFHLPCIDIWLKSHSNCPLCRANIALSVAQSPALTNHDPSMPLAETQIQAANDDQNLGRGSSQNVALMQRDHPLISPEAPSAMRTFRGLGNAEGRDHHSTIIEIGGDHHHQTIRRSVSMDDSQTSRANHVLVADIMRMNEEDEDEEEEDDDDDDFVGRCLDHHSELSAGGEVGKCSSHTKGKGPVLLHYCVINPAAMKRSLSSGRFFQTRPSRPRHTVTIPV